MRHCFILILLLFWQLSFSQSATRVEYQELGIAFSVPNEWIGQEGDGFYLVGSNTEPGFIMVTINEYTSIAQLRQAAAEGLNDQNGTTLTLSGSLETLNDQAVAGEFSGNMEGQPAKAYLIGVINPRGAGITILGGIDASLSIETVKRVSLQLWKSLEFSEPAGGKDQTKAEPGMAGGELAEWKEFLVNTRLTFMESYSSGGSTAGGYSINKEIHLCGQGYFIYSGSSNLAVGSDYSSAYSQGSSKGNGTWEVVAGNDGSSILQLTFNSGEIWEYTLGYENEKTYLDGDRYLRTTSGEYGPLCD